MSYLYGVAASDLGRQCLLTSSLAVIELQVLVMMSPFAVLASDLMLKYP